MDRIAGLCSYLGSCKTFADVGCDHGYCTKYMLENGLCDRAYISDISRKCLSKAERLLKDYIDDGRCVSVCCDGLKMIPESVELVFIGGMGGEEILKILTESYIPQNFLFQPMRNVKEVRSFLIERGAEITVDDVFEVDGKYYFVIGGKRYGNKNGYTKAQLEFGKGDINGALGEYLRSEILKKRGWLQNNTNERSREKILKEIRLAEAALKSEN